MPPSFASGFAGRRHHPEAKARESTGIDLAEREGFESDQQVTGSENDSVPFNPPETP